MSYKTFCDRCDSLIERETSHSGQLHLYSNVKNTDYTLYFEICKKCVQEVVNVLFPYKKVKI